MTGFEAIAMVVICLVAMLAFGVFMYRTGYSNGQVDGWLKRDRARGIRGFFEPWS